MINLITNENKALIESTYKKERILAYLLSATVAVGAAVLLLVPSILLLNIRLSTVTVDLSNARTRQISKDADALVDTVRQLNIKIQKLTNTVSAPSFVELTDNILGHKIAGISIDHLERKASGAVVLSGMASTRSVLLDFTKSIEADPYYTDVTSPISNLILSTDIDFTINMNLANNAAR